MHLITKPRAAVNRPSQPRDYEDSSLKVRFEELSFPSFSSLHRQLSGPATYNALNELWRIDYRQAN